MNLMTKSRKTNRIRFEPNVTSMDGRCISLLLFLPALLASIELTFKNISSYVCYRRMNICTG